jgi:hypothetical protein
MRNQGNLYLQKRKNIKTLLEELANRDLESTELKINSLIHQQKTTYREARELSSNETKRQLKDRQPQTSMLQGTQLFSTKVLTHRLPV